MIIALPPLKNWAIYNQNDSYLQKHIDAILAHELVQVDKIKRKSSA